MIPTKFYSQNNDLKFCLWFLHWIDMLILKMSSALIKFQMFLMDIFQYFVVILKLFIKTFVGNISDLVQKKIISILFKLLPFNNGSCVISKLSFLLLVQTNSTLLLNIYAIKCLCLGEILTKLFSWFFPLHDSACNREKSDVLNSCVCI